MKKRSRSIMSFGKRTASGFVSAMASLSKRTSVESLRRFSEVSTKSMNTYPFTFTHKSTPTSTRDEVSDRQPLLHEETQQSSSGWDWLSSCCAGSGRTCTSESSNSFDWFWCFPTHKTNPSREKTSESQVDFISEWFGWCTGSVRKSNSEDKNPDFEKL